MEAENTLAGLSTEQVWDIACRYIAGDSVKCIKSCAEYLIKHAIKDELYMGYYWSEGYLGYISPLWGMLTENGIKCLSRECAHVKSYIRMYVGGLVDGGNVDMAVQYFTEFAKLYPNKEEGLELLEELASSSWDNGKFEETASKLGEARSVYEKFGLESEFDNCVFKHKLL